MTGPERHSRRGIFAGLAFGLAATVVLFGAITFLAGSIPAAPQWAVLAPAIACLAAVAGTSLACLAWLSEPRRAPQLPPVPPVERHGGRDWVVLAPRDFLTIQMHMPGPDRPSADRPTPGVYQCPVRPGKPRTVADLRQLRPPPRDLSSWE